MSGTTVRPVTVEHLTVLGATPNDLLAQLRGRPAIAVVGARAATTYGQHVASELGQQIAAANATLITGGGWGIDEAAIRGALAAGGDVIVIKSTGANKTYPEGLTDLYHRVSANGGLLVSTFPDDAIASRANYLARSAVIADIAGAVIVVEAAVRSSALAIADRANGHGTPVFAVPGPITSGASYGPHKLIRDGVAKLAAQLDDLGDLDALVGQPLVKGDPDNPVEWATHAYRAGTRDGKAVVIPCNCPGVDVHGEDYLAYDGPLHPQS